MKKDDIVIVADSRCNRGNIIFDCKCIVYPIIFMHLVLRHRLNLVQLDQDLQVRVVIAVRKIQQHPSS
jgi:hypothetical protein